MKTEGFRTECLPLEQVFRKKYVLPNELLLWESFDNFKNLNVDKRNLFVFFLFYYDELVGGIIYYEKKYVGIFKLGSSPHTNLAVPYGHLYIKEQENLRTQEQLNHIFIQEFTKHIRRAGYIRFFLLIPPEFTDIREFLWNHWTLVPKYTYLLDIDHIRKSGIDNYFGKKLRNIIKTTKKQLQIRNINAEQFYSCYRDAYAYQQKSPPLGLTFFKRLKQTSGAYFLGAFDDVHLTSGVVLFEQKNKSFYISSGSKIKYRNSNGVSLILYEYIKHMVEKKKGIHMFDLVGANTPKVAHFKSIFEPYLQQYFFAEFKPFII